MPSLSPPKLISTYDSEEWEAFIEEWLQGFDPPYHLIDRLGGAGDMGRDVVGYLGDPASNCEWDNYQCKHYASRLGPSDIWVELGKLCVYSFQGQVRPPRRYRFVAPRGVSTKLHDLLRKPAELRDQLVVKWPSACEKHISDVEDFPLEGRLADYVASFDFSTVGYVPLNQIVEQHRRTRFWFQRFKTEPPVRPPDHTPPVEPTVGEAVYVSQLLNAYSQHCNAQIGCCEDLNSHPQVLPHFKRSRTYFYAAETLNRFSRDQFEPGAFDKTKKQVFDGVVDCAEACNESAFTKIGIVTERAVGIPLASGLSLSQYMTPADKKGICHHLVNDGELTWVKK